MAGGVGSTPGLNWVGFTKGSTLGSGIAVGKVTFAVGMIAWQLGGSFAASAIASVPAPATSGPATPSPQVSFSAGLAAYQARDFATAHAIFLALAELGDGPSMFNLGAMAQRGEFVAKSRGEAAGWFAAAEEAGFKDAGPLAARLRGGLDADGLAARSAILERFGINALQQRILPMEPRTVCGVAGDSAGFVSPKFDRAVKPQYPDRRETFAQSGFVLVDAHIGPDGLVSDPRVVWTLFANKVPAEAFVPMVVHGALRSRFVPAQVDGRTLGVRSLILYRFVGGYSANGVIDRKLFRRIRAQSDAGDPMSRFAVGMLGMADKTLRIPSSESERLLLSAAQAGVTDAQLRVAELSRPWSAKCLPGVRAIGWLKAATAAGSMQAREQLVRALLGGDNPPLGEVRRLLEIDVDALSELHVQSGLLAIYAASPHPELRDPARAARLVAALRAKDLRNPQDLEALAAGAAAGGDFRAAVELQGRAISQAERYYWATDSMTERLARYADEKPWHGDLLVPPVLAPAAPGSPGTGP